MPQLVKPRSVLSHVQHVLVLVTSVLALQVVLGLQSSKLRAVLSLQPALILDIDILALQVVIVALFELGPSPFV
jgi:hypothetical protein